ncbi:BLUF domain-containing protein [Cochleicola gelatinilyticus]|uniref:BLUF domain-containing protein n=1 Tax=Cochleicola gelatinilyticus TaxID=1763537 RepID=A0A167F1U2_9FLAO|nr:BLUF domain-containing protein [Cochleicola gelatinilyticus]OAB76100.1 hypothetical protein ULVI_13660 [Cochleicola gelatinilyticus]
MSYTICYFSNSTIPLEKKALEQLFTTTVHNNTQLDITGILLYESGNFFQILEGDKEALKTLYTKIKIDDRHNSIFIILDKKIEKRTFAEYKSGFSIVQNSEDLNNVERYLEASKNSLPDSEIILGLLKPFLM